MLTAAFCGGLGLASSAATSSSSLPEAAEPAERLRRNRLRRRLGPDAADDTIMVPDAPGARANRTHAGELFRFALVTDSHYWAASGGRRLFQATSDAKTVRDGLLVSDTPQTYAALLADLKRFAAPPSNGAFAIHAGDSVCGGSTFHASPAEYEAQLRAVVSMERAALGRWPVYRVPGNHDLHPTPGLGLQLWRQTLGNGSAVGYRSLVRSGWRLLLLDFLDGQTSDTDGHGHVGEAQLRWLDRQLAESEALGEQVILVGHQLLVQPTDVHGHAASWYLPSEDSVDNAEAVLAVLRRYSHVRLSLHGHVHANSLTMQSGVAFVSSAAAAEFPMQWREVTVRPCELELRSRFLDLPTLRSKSAARDTRPGRNEAKRGGALDNLVTIRTCAAP
jgi:hypothetical protein